MQLLRIRLGTKLVFVGLCVLLASCVPAEAQPTPQIITVYSTAAAQPWLEPLYACAGSSTAVMRIGDWTSADILLHVGEPETLLFPAYQIGTEDVLVVAHRQSSIQGLDLEEARALFAGLTDAAAQIWVYAPEEDIQIVFDRLVMQGDPVSPAARVALSPGQMLEVLGSETDSVGILPGRSKPANSRVLLKIANAPVLAITQREPEGSILQLLGCLQ